MARTHTVRAGECIASIGYENGFFPATLWNHPSNSGLREARRMGTVLEAGDRVFVPDLRPKEHAVASGAVHRFRRKGVPETLHLKFVDLEGRPRASLAYELDVDGAVTTGNTAADGSLRAYIPPDAIKGTLTLTGENGHPEHYRLQLGRLAPATAPAGARARLAQLGFPCATGEDVPSALRTFQREQGLPVTGENDAVTAAKLAEVFGA
ncbi:MAG TPA: peptidoglycan-binding domain-containing protein [Myxococcales bacterium]|nr:peptidoglycan-binding domain-containing protein [Myxococcales bacterium]